uniref:Ent-kaurene oxidase n=1 Tax=Kalanchoe fedtschenkoi TaxID=63787 RepID=A0A7N0ZQB3_KALFE
MAATHFIHDVEAVLPLSTITVVLGGLLLLFFAVTARKPKQKAKVSQLPPPPGIPGLPLLGNLLNLKEKKPHRTFTKWAEIYGPIYTVKLGATSMVVLNNTEVAKEAMITRYSSISTRKLSTALSILTGNKCMVATSDYNDFHKMVKRHIITSLLGSNAQKQHRGQRDAMMDNLCKQFHAGAKARPLEAANYRAIFDLELFALAIRQAVGDDVDSLYVEELGTTLSKEEMYKTMVTDLMEASIEVDWRDFFPYMSWVPNKSIEENMKRLVSRRIAVVKAMIRHQKKRFSEGKELNCFLDYLLSNAKELSEDEMATLVWEPIIETSDTTAVTTEWAMYELAKNPSHQDRLFKDIQRVCGDRKVSEDDLPQLPCLSAVFHESLRRYSPVPVIPPRYVHEDTEIGGYHISAGTQIAINLHACNMDEKKWEKPEEWNPERFLDGKFDLADRYITMAFGAGKRVCAGSLQAMLLSTSAIGRFVQEFEWRLIDSEETDADIGVLTNRKLRPLQVIAVPRVA